MHASVCSICSRLAVWFLAFLFPIMQLLENKSCLQHTPSSRCRESCQVTLASIALCYTSSIALTQLPHPAAHPLMCAPIQACDTTPTGDPLSTPASPVSLSTQARFTLIELPTNLVLILPARSLPGRTCPLHRR